MKIFFVLFYLPISLFAQKFTPAEVARWQQQSKQVTIIRDNWGIPHVYGNTDADAVFGLMYAQCEDDFKRVELNYIDKLGRQSEIKGEAYLQNDLYIKLLIDSADAVADYTRSPAWMKKLLNAFADGVNYYLYTHPKATPALLNRFKPWYPLLWTDGSIGAISTGDVTMAELSNFYLGGKEPTFAFTPNLFAENTSGSNGFAIAPSKTQSGNAILYINPHVSFYFRPEVHMVSNEGLQVYGAATWGQFFIYQGFNEHCGWMHTSNNVDVADVYEEKIENKDNQLFYHYNKKIMPLGKKRITLKYVKNGKIETKNILTYATQHGPIMANRNGKWLSVKSENRILNGLLQCFLRTKTKGLEDYKINMAYRGNPSNNTVFADDKGNIAYWHGNFIPKRNPVYNWSLPVDGTTAATDWQGLHTVDETVHVYNPASGWIQNCNSTAFTVAGSSSPQKENYPKYMAPDGENFRALNAIRLLEAENKFTLDKTIAAGYSTYLAAFEVLIPALVKAYNHLDTTQSIYTELMQPMAVLKNWNYYSSTNSVATTLALEWIKNVHAGLQRIYINESWEDQVTLTKKFAATSTEAELLPPLQRAVIALQLKYGTWQMPWGNINRYQRQSGEINPVFSDSLPSYPVAFTTSAWGMLPAFNSVEPANCNKKYGIGGNSFVCAVEFGKKIKAKSLLAGGESGNADSKHFADQLEMYTKGQFKDVLFYKEDVMKHSEKTYHPGEGDR